MRFRPRKSIHRFGQTTAPGKVPEADWQDFLFYESHPVRHGQQEQVYIQCSQKQNQQGKGDKRSHHPVPGIAGLGNTVGCIDGSQGPKTQQGEL